MGLNKMFFLLCFSVSVYSAEETEEKAIKRIHSHLFIQDPSAAVKDTQKFLALYPDSTNLRLAYLKALCQKGEEVEAFKQFLSIFKTIENQDSSNRSTLEWLAWGGLNKSEESPL